MWLKWCSTECAKFCETELAPLNQSGDKEGCQWQDGKVTTPKGFKQAYQNYIDEWLAGYFTSC